MDQYQTLIEILALTMGAAWASGINLYAAILMLGYMGSTGNMTLPPDLLILTDPMVMMAAGLMYMVEFVADKTPGVDTGWDALHTFIRIPAGAILAAGAVGDVSVAAELAAAIVGGGVAATTHATKAGGRMLINTSPEPVTNWVTSIAEDVAVIGGLWTALNYPLLFLVGFILLMVAMFWIIPKLWRVIKGLGQRLHSMFLGSTDKSDPLENVSGFSPPPIPTDLNIKHLKKGSFTSEETKK